MEVFRRFLPLIPVAVAALGCGSSTPLPPPCADVVEYSAGPVNVSGYEGFDCAVSFSSEGGPWVTTILAATAVSSGPAPSAPTLTDGCSTFVAKPEASVGCSAQAGPLPNVCGRSSTCLSVKATGSAARELRTFLGGKEPYDVEVVCGGVLLMTRSASSLVSTTCGGF